MAEVWGAALATAGAAYGAHEQGKAGEAAARGSREAAALSQAQYEQSRRDQIPYMQAGQNALTQLQNLNRGDYSGFTESPDYQFARDQGIKGLDRSAASRGTQYSGGQLAALADYSGGLASQTYGDYYNRIANLAGLGQNAAAGVGNQGMAYAGQAGDAIMQGANANAFSQLAQGSTYLQGAGQIADLFTQQRTPPNTTSAFDTPGGYSPRASQPSDSWWRGGYGTPPYAPPRG